MSEPVIHDRAPPTTTRPAFRKRRKTQPLVGRRRGRNRGPGRHDLGREPARGRGDLRSIAADRGPLAMEAISASARTSGSAAASILHAVRDVSFSLYQGAVVALVGESGSGKSTVARLLAGQERLTAGTIGLDGKPSTGPTARFRKYKSQVQLVFQDPFASLNPVHTVALPPGAPGAAAPAHDVKDVDGAVTALLEQVRLTPADQFMAKYPHELSGGQRQRVAFARALAAQPSVLLADEPVSMLDVSIRLEMLSLLDDLRSRLHLALLYITHDIASARYFADEVLVMYAGQIVERGPGRGRHPAARASLHAAAGRVRARPRQPRQRAQDQHGRGRQRRRPDHRRQHGGPAAVGCPFSPRCPLATTSAGRTTPRLSCSTPTRAAACWRLDVAAAQADGSVHRPRQSPEMNHRKITRIKNHPRGKQS